MTRLLTDKIWQATRKAKRSGKVTALVAYVTHDHLHLGRGDTLVCDASDRTIGQGATSASVLESLRAVGVRLFHLPNLHAKVVRLPDQVLLGSANMTVNTAKLHEAAILSKDPAVLKQADEFIGDVLSRADLKRLTAKELKRLLGIPVVRPSAGTGGMPDPTGISRLWISRVDPLGDRAAAEISADLGSRMNDGQPYEGSWIVMGPEDAVAGSVQINDRLILVDREHEVTGPHLVTGIHARRKSRRGKHIEQIVVTYDEMDGGRRVWKKVERALRDTGARTRPGRPRLMVLGEDASTEILGILGSKEKSSGSRHKAR